MSDSEYTVRLATLADAGAVFSLCVDLHAENALFPIDKAKYEARIAEILATPEEWLSLTGVEKTKFGFIAVAEKRGIPAGALVVSIEKLWYTEAECLSELFNYVAPEHRRSDCAKKLIGFAKELADEMNMTLLIGVLSTTRTEAKVRLYGRHFTPVGAFFVHLNDGAVH